MEAWRQGCVLEATELPVLAKPLLPLAVLLAVEPGGLLRRPLQSFTELASRTKSVRFHSPIACLKENSW